MLSAIVAYDLKKGIGLNGRLPWHIPEDLKIFKQITTGKIIVGGRVTFESIGRALPNRHCYMLSTSNQNKIPGINLMHDPQQALQMAKMQEVIVIGGASIYKLFGPFYRRLYISHIQKIFDADTFFPNINDKDFQVIEERPLKSKIPVIFRILELKQQYK